MQAIATLDNSEIDSISGGMGFFERVGWAYDNPGEAIGRGVDRFYAWYRISPSEDRNWFID